MEFAILGPVEVRLDGSEVALGGPKQRALLAVLLLARNEVVSRDRLVDALWGERPPATAQRSLDSYVSRLRRVLGQDRLIRRAPGYVLRADPGELDLDRFEALVARAGEARATEDHEAAARVLSESLAIWRGPALADLLFEPFAGAESERLEQRRLDALEQRIDAQLAGGAGPELVAELEALVREHPFRERLVGQLMLALYRSGRQADALAAYQDARQRLARELGLEPASQLRDLEQRMLRHDPGLDSSRRRARTPARSRKRLLLAAVATAVCAGVITALVLHGGSASSPSEGSGTAPRLVGIDPGTGGRAASIALTGAPAALAARAGAVWAADSEGETVARVSPSSGAVIDRIPVAGQPGSLAAGGGAVWAASTVGGTIQRIDRATGAVTQTVRLGGDNVAGITFGDGVLWAADVTEGSVVEIDPRTGSLGRTLKLDLRPTAIVAGGGSIWVADESAGAVEELDPASGAVRTRVHAGNGPAALALSHDAVWVANTDDSTVSRIDRRTGAVVATLAVGSGPSALALTGGSVWVASRYSGEVARIDTRTNRVAHIVKVAGRPAALASGGGVLWVGAGADAAGHKGGTLRLVTTSPIPTIDPAFANTAEPFQFIRLAYDTLVTFEASPGPGGLRLVPDLALAVPSPSRAGTSYTFRLRSGIRYSDGRRLRASDFRRTFERLFRIRSPGADYYRGIVGAAECDSRPADCDLSDGVVADDRAGTVTFHLVSPDPDFPFKLTVFGYSAPSPPGTPDRDVGSRAVPGTGPYRIAPRTSDGIELVRNRHFREWSHAAQPEGNPDRVIWSTEPSRRAAVRHVQRGRADWFFGLPASEDLPRLRIAATAQLHQDPTMLIDFTPLNTHRPPFDDVRVRRALNYAIDRGKVTRMYGGRPVAPPTCQTLMPGILGYRPYCPYTRPGRPGEWTAPDLARALRLVAASGTRGQRVDVWGPNDGLGTPRRLPPYFARVLRSLGYRTKLHMIHAADFTPRLRRRIQLSVDGDWLPDYPAPSSLLPPFFGCNGGLSNGYVCDPGLDRRMQQASSLELRSPPAGAKAWARVDREIVRDAYWVPTVRPQAPELVSKRLRNYQSNPIWGFIADQAWLR
ncbi:MAG TPA: BTAD domain-containing putative transcriptional regulator [Thermoleophilaceae bacterium]